MNPTIKTILITLGTIAVVFRMPELKRLVTGSY